MAKNKEITIDELAIMVQKGFDSMDKKMDKGFESMNNEINGAKKEMFTMTKQIDNLQRGQVRIEDRLDEIVPQVKGQEKRITILEKKVALAR